MRASDLLGSPVVDPHGRRLGKVMGIRCVQDGPIRGTNATLRVDALVVHRRAIGAFLGFHLRDQPGPQPLGALMRWVHRDARLVLWASITELGADKITADVD